MILFSPDNRQLPSTLPETLLNSLRQHSEHVSPFFKTSFQKQTTLFGLRKLQSNLFLIAMLPEQELLEEGQKLGINYGFDRIRFPSPVPVGSKIRATNTLKRVEIKGGMIETMTETVVEAEGSEKPVCVAESLGRMVF